jgi:hypothetical protein
VALWPHLRPLGLLRSRQVRYARIMLAQNTADDFSFILHDLEWAMIKSRVCTKFFQPGNTKIGSGLMDDEWDNL